MVSRTLAYRGSLCVCLALAMGWRVEAAEPATPPAVAANAAPSLLKLGDPAQFEAITCESATKALIDVGGKQVLKIGLSSSADYPGVNFTPAAGVWDLSAFKGVEATVTNKGTAPLLVAIRVDNPGDWTKNPWNTDQADVGPGQTKVVRVTFGQSYGHPGYALDPKKVAQVKLFTAKPASDTDLLVLDLKPFGASGVKPQADSPAQSASTGHTVTPSASGSLLDFGKVSADGLPEGLKGTSSQVSTTVSEAAAGKALTVTIQPGPEGYPGINLTPAGGSAWNVAAYGHVEARIANTGTKPLTICLRLDNDGDWTKNPWNGENGYIKPGATATVQVRFGYSFGHPGYPLKPEAISKVMLFAGKSDAVQSFRVESLVAGGAPGEKPAVDPASVRVKPTQGLLLGAGVTVDAGAQVSAKGTQAAVTGQGMKVSFPAAKGEQSVALKPAVGRWDLRDYVQVKLKVRNQGDTPVTPRVRLETNGGPSNWVTTSTPLAPGAVAELTIPFAATVPWQGIKNSGNRTSWDGQPGTGTKVTSDAVGAVTVSAQESEQARTLLVEWIQAGVPADAEIPSWLGQRPPVPGNWTRTFDDEFDGTSIDATKWSIYGDNYWDKTSHFSKDNVIVRDGFATLRFSKTRGHHNDDPNKKATDYATGFLNGYDHWTQRYGYFETRVKLPKAPGLWPAFWLMPDRAGKGDPQWVRQDTGKQGMEFDVMEQLTRWGPHRYNIAWHWDGYNEGHKQTGTDKIYFQADKDGFITAGLLWEPGLAVYYCNGKEVARWEDPRISSVQSNMMFTLPMGGWDNSPLDDSQLPDDFVIDYVRVWQRSDLAQKP